MLSPSIKYGLASDSFGTEEIDAAVEVLRSGRYTMGEYVYKFEREFADWIGAKHAIMVAKLKAFINYPQQTLQDYPETDTSYPARYARVIATYKTGKWDDALSQLEPAFRIVSRCHIVT